MINRIQENSSLGQQAEHAAEQAMEYSQEAIKEHPVLSTTVAFGVGIGVGLFIASMITESRSAQEEMTHKFGQKMYEAFTSAMPESWAKVMHG